MLSVLIYGGIGLYLSRLPGFRTVSLGEPTAGYLKWTFLAIAVVLFPVLRRMKEGIAAPRTGVIGAAAPAAPRADAARYVILFALAEMPAILGLVLFLLGAPVNVLLLTVGLSLFYLVTVTPPSGMD